MLDGILTDPPALALPPSATVASTAAAVAAQMVMGPNSTLAATGLAAGKDWALHSQSKHEVAPCDLNHHQPCIGCQLACDVGTPLERCAVVTDLEL